MTTTRTRLLSSLTAAALGAAGLLATANPAAAEPCQKYKYSDNHFMLNQSTGHYVAMYIDENGQLSGPASHTNQGKADTMGTVVGGVFGGGGIHFEVNWDSGAYGVYEGKIRDDGTVGGNTRNTVNGQSASWEATGRFTCADAPAPAPAPPPGRSIPKTGNAPGQEPAPVAVNTITSDVDIYQVPGGVGEPYGIVPGGTKVTVKTRQDDNWVNISGDGVPGGSGWVWGDFVG